MLKQANYCFAPIPDKTDLKYAFAFLFGTSNIDREKFLGPYLKTSLYRAYSDETYTGKAACRHEIAKAPEEKKDDSPAFTYICQKGSHCFYAFYFVVADAQDVEVTVEVSPGDEAVIYVNNLEEPADAEGSSKKKKSRRKKKSNDEKQTVQARFEVGMNVVVVEGIASKAEGGQFSMTASIEGEGLHQVLHKSQKADMDGEK